MLAWSMAVASMFTSTSALRPARRSCSYSGGISTTNMNRPASMASSTSPDLIIAGRWNRGG